MIRINGITDLDFKKGDQPRSKSIIILPLIQSIIPWNGILPYIFLTIAYFGEIVFRRYAVIFKGYPTLISREQLTVSKSVMVGRYL